MAVATAVLAAVAGTFAVAPASAQPAQSSRRVDASGVSEPSGVSSVIPAPTTMRPVPGQSFTLSPETPIVVDGTAPVRRQRRRYRKFPS